MKKKERRPEELGSQWLNAMCDILIGGALAGVTSILALLAWALSRRIKARTVIPWTAVALSRSFFRSRSVQPFGGVNCRIVSPAAVL